METRKDCSNTFSAMRDLGADGDQEQQHGGNAMVLKAGEEGGKKGLEQSKPTEGELDEGKPAPGELAEGKLAQEEPAQCSLAQEATEEVEEGEIKEEEMGGGHAAAGSSGPVDNEAHEEGGHGGSVDQQQPQPEAAMPEGTNSPQTGERLPVKRRTRFTLSQLQDLEQLFQENRHPSLRMRKDLARWLGVSEADVQDWFRNRRAVHRRNTRLLVLCNTPPAPENNDA
ncbi:homeobox protein Rhox5-like [Chionomys nivalis]|uniref:homeobox protein Rhox5-like n=1 Tax=Chionomys nivalis TaxID=269649 RepID=UPI0025967AEA|nr:homeobox protein Rhox5-like [Chionomys nivalis]